MARPKPFRAIRLREVLVERGLQEQVIAHRLGITKSALSRKLNGSRPWSLSELDKVARYLGLPAEDLFPRSER